MKTKTYQPMNLAVNLHQRYHSRKIKIKLPCLPGHPWKAKLPPRLKAAWDRRPCEKGGIWGVKHILRTRNCTQWKGWVGNTCPDRGGPETWFQRPILKASPRGRWIRELLHKVWIPEGLAPQWKSELFFNLLCRSRQKMCISTLALSEEENNVSSENSGS